MKEGDIIAACRGASGAPINDNETAIFQFFI